MLHKTVLLQEAIEGLHIKKGDIFVDGTLGGGGHLEEVLKRFGQSISIIALDLDIEAVDRAKARTQGINENVVFVQGSFRSIDKIVSELGKKNVDKILLDIGLSSNQFEDSG